MFVLKIIAVIVNYNRLKLLKNCIKSIQNGKKIPDEIIVVDNNSTDGSTNWLKARSNVYPILLDENRGGSYAFSLGMQAASRKHADWIWTLDEDVLLDAYCLSTMVDHINTTPRVDFVSPLVLTEDGEINTNSLPELSQCGNLVTTTFIGTLVKTASMESVGPPIHNMFRFYDDLEFFLRLTKSGFIGHYLKEARLTHFSTGNLLEHYFLTSRTDVNSRIYLRNYYFYLSIKIGKIRTIATILSDILLKRKKLEQEHKNVPYISFAIFKSAVSGMLFRPQKSIDISI